MSAGEIVAPHPGSGRRPESALSRWERVGALAAFPDHADVIASRAKQSRPEWQVFCEVAATGAGVTRGFWIACAPRNDGAGTVVRYSASLPAFQITPTSASTGCAPDTAYFPLKIKNGTPDTPMRAAVEISSRTVPMSTPSA